MIALPMTPRNDVCASLWKQPRVLYALLDEAPW